MALISTHKLHRRQGLRQALFEFLQNLAWNAVLATFFHQIEVVGLENLPDYGPTIIVGNHNNQFVDGILLNTVVNQKGRAVQFLIAAKSWKRPFIGDIARLMKCIPVARAQDSAKAGTGSLTVAAGETTVRGVQHTFY
jgi:glycerol-3-phosphate O-acyltransferase/dihydroxyacetone phosphate acyltransferase